MSTASPAAGRLRPTGSVLRRTIDLERLGRSAPLAGLLGLTAVLYLWSLSRNGYANEYYAAAVQAGTHSWKAFLFGSFDAANYITVDKPPASLWLMELSSRFFGFSSFSMLLPQALEGVAAVGLLYATVRRWFGSPAGLLSGLILALTPMAALMFRFNNPDALLVLLFVLAAYALTRALEHGATRWLLVSGAAVGFAFLTKELQALLVVPVLAGTYLLAAPVGLRRRIWQLLAAGGALVLSASWWVALVQLWPSGSRPYFGDSTNNSILQVIFGANGLDRISSGGFGGGPGGGFSGSAGAWRLFNTEMGGQISWLLPAAAIALVAGLVWRRPRPRTDRIRAALLLWGGWLVLTAAVFSFMTGVIHPYYTNSLAPAVAVLVGGGVTFLWRHREQAAARVLLGAMLLSTSVLAYVLLARAPGWHPWLRFTILIAGPALALATLAIHRLSGGTSGVLATAGVVVALAGPTAYTLSAVASAQSGGNPLAGPAIASADGFGLPMGRPPGGGYVGGELPEGGPPAARAATSRALTSLLERDAGHYTWVAATDSSQNGAALELATGRSVMALGGFAGSDPAITLTRFRQLVASGRIHYYVAGGGFGPSAAGAMQGGLGPGPSGAMPGGFGPAAGRELPDGRGGPAGFPTPPNGLPGRPVDGPLRGRSAVSNQIQSWVTEHFRSTTVGGTTVYDLTAQKAGS